MIKIGVTKYNQKILAVFKRNNFTLSNSGKTGFLSTDVDNQGWRICEHPTNGEMSLETAKVPRKNPKVFRA